MARPDSSAERGDAARPLQPVIRRREDSQASTSLLNAPWKRSQTGPEAHAALSASLQDTFGNELMVDALAGVGEGPAPLIEAAMTLGAAGVAMPSSADQLLSNSVVNDLMARSAESQESEESFAEDASRRIRTAKTRGGQPLPEGLRQRFERAFGDVDFSRVRVHTDGAAAQATRGVNALAYTMGEEIWFSPGRYDPASAAGQRLLAHELTHVVQHQEGRLKPAASGGAGRAGEVQVSSPMDALEREAEAHADDIQAEVAADLDLSADLTMQAPETEVTASDAPAAEGEGLFRSERAPSSHESVQGEDQQAAHLSRADLYATPEGEYAAHEDRVDQTTGRLKAILADSERWDSLEESERGKALREAVGGILDSLDSALKVVFDLSNTTLDFEPGALVASLGASIGVLEWLAQHALREEEQVAAPEADKPTQHDGTTELGQGPEGPDPAAVVDAALTAGPNGGSAFTRAAREAVASAMGMLSSVKVLFTRIREQEPEAKEKSDPNNDRDEHQLRKEHDAEHETKVSDQLQELEARLDVIRGQIASGPDLSSAGGANIATQEEEVDKDKLSNLRPAVILTDTSLRRRPKEDDPQSFMVNLVAGVRVGFQLPTRGWVQVVVLEGRDEGRAGYIQRDALKPMGDEGTLNRHDAGPIARDAVPTAEKPQGGGQALPAHLIEQFLPVLGPAVRNVRVHLDEASSQFAQAVQATAVTSGADVFFKGGTFRPGTREGDELIAEEVFHGVQGGGRGISQPGDAHEKQAREFAETFAGGPGRAIAQMTAGIVNNQIIERLATRLGLPSPTPRRENPTARQAGPGGRGPGSEGAGGKRVRRRRTTLDDIAQELIAGLGPSGEMIQRQGDGLNRQADSAPATEAAAPGTEGAQDEEREPTPEELAALDAGTAALASGQAQTASANAMPEEGQAQDVEAAEREDEQVDTAAAEADAERAAMGGPGGSESAASGEGAGEGALPDAQCDLSPETAAVLSAGGPERNAAVAASDALLASAQAFDSTAVDQLSNFTNGPMAGGTGGGQATMSPAQVLGKGNAVQTFLGTRERGDGALATTIEVLDGVRVVAGKISSIASKVQLVSGLLSLIGLFPPAAPIGAALATFSTVVGRIGDVATLVELGSTALVSILSAIQLVAAVKEGAPEALDLYGIYREDVGTMVGAGIAFGIDKITDRLTGGNKERRNAARDNLFQAAGQADGRVARGTLYRGLRDSNGIGFKPNLLSTSGSTVASLRRNLSGTLALRQGADALASITKSQIKGQAGELNTAANESGVAEVSAVRVSIPDAPPPLSIGAVHWPVAPAPQGPANRPRDEITPPDHNPSELDQIIQRIHDIDAALGHIRTEKNEAQAAQQAADELQTLATERDTLAGELEAQAAEHQAAFVQMQADAAQGQQQAAQGVAQAAQQSAGAQQAQAGANQANATVGNVSVPPPQPQGLFGRAKAWFQEKVVAKIKEGVQWVQDQIAGAILSIIGKLMGIDDVHAELAQMQADMGVAANAAEGAQQMATEISAQAAQARQQAADAQSAADAARSQAQAEVSEATNLDQQLVGTKQGLAEEMRRVREEMIAFDREQSERLASEGSQQDEVDPGTVGACGGLIDYADNMLATQESELSGTMASAEGDVAQAAEGAGVGGQPASALAGARAEFKAAQDRRRAALADVRTDLGNLSALGGGDAQKALAELGRIVQQVQQQADGDAEKVHAALTQILGAARNAPSGPSAGAPGGMPGGLRTPGPAPGARTGAGGPPAGARPGGPGGPRAGGGPRPGGPGGPRAGGGPRPGGPRGPRPGGPRGPRGGGGGRP